MRLLYSLHLLLLFEHRFQQADGKQMEQDFAVGCVRWIIQTKKIHENAGRKKGKACFMF